MKSFRLLLLVACSFLAATSLFAQEKQNSEPQFLLSKTGSLSFSGFGAPIVEFSSVDGELGVSTGGGGAVLINQTFFVGGYGMGLATDMPQYDLYIKDENSGLVSKYNDRRPMLGHGGFWLGYINNSKNIFHWSVSSKIGWGAVSMIDKEYRDMDNELGWDGVFVLTPQAEFEINMLKWFKINLGLGYRYVAGVNHTYVDQNGLEKTFFDKNAFNSPVGSVTLLFGNFLK
jgi:hypothetical protein